MEDSRTGVYTQEGTTSRVMVADRPYGEFYDFYSFSLEYFGFTLISKLKEGRGRIYQLKWQTCFL
jgi:hypothetical protein